MLRNGEEKMEKKFFFCDSLFNGNYLVVSHLDGGKLSFMPSSISC